MTLLETGTTVIQALNAQGLGTGKTKKGPVALPYTLPGELVSFDRHRYRGKTNCLLKEIITPSPRRVQAPCPVFTRCGGCLLQHLNEEDYTAFKEGVLADQLARHNLTPVVAPMVKIAPGQRRRMTLHLLKKQGKLFLGFHRFHASQIIAIEACPAVHPTLSALIPAFHQFLAPTLADHQKASLSITLGENGMDVLFEPDAPWKGQDLEAFCANHNIQRFRVHGDTLYLNEIPFVHMGGRPVEIEAHTFLQASAAADEALTSLVSAWLAPYKGGKAVDLFCGRGTYTLPLSAWFEMDGFESSEDAVSSLKNHLETVFLRDLYNNPLGKKALRVYQVAVVNPPRTGLGAQGPHLAQSSLERICYVSCNPETFAKDALVLCQGGYDFVKVTAVDQFPWTPHLEVVGYFEK